MFSVAKMVLRYLAIWAALIAVGIPAGVIAGINFAIWMGGPRTAGIAFVVLGLLIGVVAYLTYRRRLLSWEGCAFVGLLLTGMAVVVLALLAQEPIDLVNGYQLVQVDGGGRAVINSESRIVVAPNVVIYKILQTYIVGTRTKDDQYDDPEFSGKFGSFILDTQSGNYVEGLDNSAFSAALQSRGLDPAPFDK